MSWPGHIYVATTANGVFYTENFIDPTKQPTWTAINAGLPSLDVKEFFVDPTNPDARQYLILESTRTIYMRSNHGRWFPVLDRGSLPYGGDIGGFCCDETEPGIMYAMCGASTIVYTPDYYYLMQSVDYGLTWQYYADAGGHTIWTYGLGSVRARNGTVYYTTSQNLGAHGSVNNSWIDWNYTPPVMIDPNNLSQPYVAVNASSGCDLARITAFNTESWATFSILQNDIGPLLRWDCMWFNSEDPTHSRLVRGGTLYSTRDSWSTIYSTNHIEGEHVQMLCSSNSHEDTDQIFLGMDGGHYIGDEHHMIGVIYGEDDSTVIGIAGSMASTSPYTGSIPWNSGAISQNGIHVFGPVGGAHVYAVAMPDYSGEHRGVPMAGDRSAWDVVNYAERHAIDLGLLQPVHHVPEPNYPDSFVYSEDGESWSTVRIPLSAFSGSIRQTILTFSGELTVVDNPYKIYNLFGDNQTLQRVFLSVSSAPLGTDLIVDIHQDGTTIFTNQDNRPRIVAGSTTGYTEDFSTQMWARDSYLTAHVDQIGDEYAGSYLVVHIVHGYGAFSRESTVSAYMSGGIGSSVSAFLQGPTGSILNAYLRGPDPETSSKSAYLKYAGLASDDKSSYVYGVEKPDSSTPAYMQGGY